MEQQDNIQVQQAQQQNKQSVRPGRHGRSLTQVVRQRREREKQELKLAILAAARDIALHDGWQAVTIRKVAERIEYSPPTIYEYFDSKDDILSELVHDGFVQMEAALRATKGLTNDPEARLFSMVDAYLNFALRNPELYQVMHDMGITCLHKPLNERGASVATLEALNDWMHYINVTIPDIEDAFEILRSSIHGVISLYMGGHFEGGEPRLRRLAHRTLRGLLVAWHHSQ